MTTDEKKFAGFAQPKENWSKLPHALIDELSNITSESELKVILYILRHTWGYGDSEKRISIEEFCKGRKRNDGSRVDAGCGISINSVKSGIENAVKHGYINVEEDTSDKARIKRFYSINSGGQLLTVGGQKLTPWGSEVDPRTEKETIERNLLKEVTAAAAEIQPVVIQKPKTGTPTRNRKTDPGWDTLCSTYENEIGLLTPLIADALADLADQYPSVWITDALAESVRANVRKLSYASKILERWQTEGRDNANANYTNRSGGKSTPPRRDNGPTRRDNGLSVAVPEWDVERIEALLAESQRKRDSYRKAK